MQPQSLTATEAKLLSAFRALPANTQMRLFRSIDELAEAIEDEQDAQEADRILARIRAGEEETVPFDEVVKSLGFTPKAR